MLYTLILLACMAGFAFAMRSLCKTKTPRGLETLETVFGGVLLGLIFAKGFFSDTFVYVINGGTYSTVYCNSTDIPATFLRWAISFSEILAAASALFGTRISRRLLRFAGVPSVVLSSFFSKRLISYYTEDPMLNYSKRGLILPSPIRVAAFLLALFLVFAIAALDFFATHRGERSEAGDRPRTLKLLGVGVICSMPFLTLCSLFGNTDYILGIGDPLQFLWIAVMLGGFLGIWFLFRNEPEEDRKFLMAFLTVALAVHHNSIYLHGIRYARLPFQLCNIATYFLLILLFVRKQAFYDFILIANCPGCIIAIATVTEDSPLFSFWSMHYYIQHTLVFLIPLLLAALGVFRIEEPKKALKHYFIGFSVYFVLMVLLTGLGNGVFAAGENFDHTFFNSANFFYTYECPVDGLDGLFRALQILPIPVFGCTFYGGYLAFIYAVFSALAAGEYFLNRWITKIYARLHAKDNAPAEEAEAEKFEAEKFEAEKVEV